MHVVIEHAGRTHEVDLVVRGDDVRVSDLLACLEPAPAAADAARGEAVGGGRGRVGVLLDGRWYPPTERLDELPIRPGATLAVTTPRPPGPHRDTNGQVVLVTLTGVDAGTVHPVDGEVVVVGRGSGCDVTIDDPTVSHRHARLERDVAGGYRIRDLGSRNGTWIEGEPVTGATPLPAGARLRFGAVHVRLGPFDLGDHVRRLEAGLGVRAGPQPFNRPPRPGPAVAGPPLVAPEPPSTGGAGRRLGALGLVGPLVLGAALVATTGSPRYALFALMSPLLFLGHRLTARRRDTGQRRDHAAALRRLAHDLAHRRDAERRRREDRSPDLAEVVRRATAPSTTLWQRRRGDADFLRLRLGTGDVPWDVPVTLPGGAATGRSPERRTAPELAAVLDRFPSLPRAPVEVDLSGGRVLGLVGDRRAAAALARALLCQVAVHHGPADVAVVVATARDHAADWDWAKWLPHVRDPTRTGRLLAGDRATAVTLLDRLLVARDAEDDRAGTVTLYLLDDAELWRGPQAAARALLSGRAGPAAGIVLAERDEDLPAVCDTVVELRDDLGTATVRRPREQLAVDLVIAGTGDATARRCARALARFEDPELTVVGTGLPPVVRLLPLFGPDAADAARIAAGWHAAGPDPPPSTPIGLGERGPVEVDLVRDGPHGLVAGTTGAGKSELLRTLVAGLATRVDPDHLVFVLVDYKGGSAFDHCARLPHVVGLVTDLDHHLGERALTSLEAELRHREQVLRDAAAQDLAEYLRLGAPGGPLPRLVVVVDEFATLAAELPDFLGSLVGVAQRGRSLGVHLLLATQRPRGAVSADIAANTNLRIALRMQVGAESVDVIGGEQAARIGRDTPGRAYVRLGHGDLEVVQTALSTASAPTTTGPGVTLRPFEFGPRPATPADDPGPGEGVPDDAPSDLRRLVDAVTDAVARRGRRPPRRPWLPMLPERLDLAELLDRDDAHDPVVFALADEPDRQRQVPVGWDPAAGHLALFGMVGSGTTTALRAVACALAAAEPPDRCHLYAVDAGAGDLTSLAALPHVGAVIAAHEHERQFRLVRTLRRELEHRRRLDTADRAEVPHQVVLIDGVGAFLAEHDGVDGQEVVEGFRRLVSEGPAVGIVFVLAAERPGALPARLGGLVARRLLFRLADPGDHAAAGLRPGRLPTFVPGRAVEAGDGRVVQVGLPGEPTTVAAALRERWGEPAPGRGPRRVDALPRLVRLDALPAVASVDRPPLRVPIGVADDDLATAALELHIGEHASVAGPPRSGRSTTLAVVAHQLRRAAPELVLVAVCRERSPLFGSAELDAYGTPDTLRAVIARAADDPRPWVVLVDDAETVDDPDGDLLRLVACGRPGLHVVAAGRADALRGDYGSWTREVRRSRTGLLLQPDLGTDGDLLGVRLPRRMHAPLVPGRGFLVADGMARLIQVAQPPPPRPSSGPAGYV